MKEILVNICSSLERTNNVRKGKGYQFKVLTSGSVSGSTPKVYIVGNEIHPFSHRSRSDRIFLATRNLAPFIIAGSSVILQK